MIEDDWRQIKEAFWKVLDGAEDDAAGLDSHARAEVKALVDEHFSLESRPGTPPPEPAPAPPALPSRFEVRGHLGSGAFGEVYRVFDRAAGSVVALKVLRDSQSWALYYFKREFRELADIRHPNLVALHELIVHDQRWMFTMELVEGVPFHQYIADAADGEREARIRACVLQLAAGLNALHERQLVHRDLKPSNVLIARDHRVVILDFGLTRAFSATEQRGATLAGTPEYMSPEQMAGEPLTGASDWYALGVMLYETLTGAVPFSGGLLTILKHKRFGPPIEAGTVSGAAPDLNELCAGLLAIDPARRHGFADVVRVLGPAAANPARIARRPRLVGRESELHTLRAAYDGIKRGRPAIVHISGSSGIGKSSLVREFIGQLEAEESVLAFEGRCFESESVPYQGLDDVVDQLSHYLRSLSQTDLEPILPRHFGALTRMMPVLGQLRRTTARESLPVDSYELRRLAFASLAELLGRLAERRRLVLAIDDLQWGDRDGCMFFEDLMTGPGAPPILLLLSYRTETVRTSPWLVPLRDPSNQALAAITVHLELQRLDASQARRLAQALGASDRALSDAALAQVEEQSAGEPFLIHEIMRWVNLRGSDGALAAPFSLADVLLARTRSIGGDAMRLLQLLVIAGQPIGRTVIQAALPSPQFAGSRDRLLNERLVRSQLVEGREMMETYHDRLRAVLLSLMSAPEIVDRHRDLAEAFEKAGADDPEQAAMHFHAAGDLARAAAHAVRAAERAAAAFAFNAAARLYQLALDAGTLGADERRGIHQKLGDALSNADRGPDAAAAYLAAAEGASAHDGIRLRASAASQLLRSGHIHRGIAMLEDLVRQTGVTVMRSVFARLCHVVWLRARIQARGLGFKEHAAIELPDDARIRLDVCWIGAVGTGMIEPLRSAEFSAKYVLLALKSGDPYRILLALAGESTQICHVPSGGDPRKAFALVGRAAEMAERLGDPYARAFTTLMECIVSFLHGKWRRAAELGDAACERLRAECTNVAWEQSTGAIIAFNARALRGDWHSNRERLPGLLRDAEDRGDLHASLSLRLIGNAYMIALADDEPERARAQLRQDLGAWPHHQYDLQKACGLQGDVDASLYLGRPLDAWQRIREEWPLLGRSQLLRVPTMFVFLRCARARAALGLASQSGIEARLRAQLVKAARHEANQIRRRCAAWSYGLVDLIEAGAAACRDETGPVREHLHQAEQALLDADLGGFAMAARWRRAAYEPREAAESLRTSAQEWAKSRGVKRFDRLVECLAPGPYRHGP
jgi:serine/threonine protein kinase